MQVKVNGRHVWEENTQASHDTVCLIINVPVVVICYILYTQIYTVRICQVYSYIDQPIQYAYTSLDRLSLALGLFNIIRLLWSM